MGVDRLKKKIILALILLVVSSTIHCTPKGQVIKENDEAALRRRVQEFWSYKIKGEWDKGYLYESPDFRKKTTQEIYILQNKRSVMRLEEFDVLELWASGNEGYVKLRARVRYLLPKFSKSPFEKVVEEQWMKERGLWYHFSPPA